MHTDQQPTLRQLMLLKSPSGKAVEIFQSITPHWKNLGVYFDLDEMGCILDCIARDHQYSLTRCFLQMMNKWLQGCGRQPVTWATLIEVLKEANYIRLAIDVKEAVLSQRDEGKAMEDIEKMTDSERVRGGQWERELHTVHVTHTCTRRT